MALIPLDKAGTVFCHVDARDSRWARKWQWRAQYDKHKRKLYAVRNTRINGKQVKLYMHKEILKRTGLLPPTPWHVIGEHRNGDSLNNRRANLTWFTRGQNRRTARVREEYPAERYLCGDPSP